MNFLKYFAYYFISIIIFLELNNFSSIIRAQEKIKYYAAAAILFLLLSKIDINFEIESDE
jgi:ABC-type arginine transport system permease subunit